MKTENELIAEFMGVDFTAKDAYLTYPPPICKRFGQYDRSWDWLMPVVEKCYKMQKGKWNDMTRLQYNFIEQALVEVKIEPVYKQVVEFIKWYNNQKK